MHISIENFMYERSLFREMGGEVKFAHFIRRISNFWMNSTRFRTAVRRRTLPPIPPLDDYPVPKKNPGGT